MTGRTISHYRVQEKLGEGGMGVVYRALDTRLERIIAIKLLRPEAVGDPERKWRFVREAKAASALNHPNIVTIHDIDTADGVDFIAMEHVEGQPLDRVIAERRLPVDEAVSYAVQIAGALSAAHSAGIVHRDIKPANVMAGPAGHVKVLDFGLAKLIESIDVDEAAPTASAGSSLPPQTRGGVVLGTLSYMSPEQAEGKPVDARSDVFSFGALLYEMLAGHRPFQGDSQLSTLTAILRDSPPPLKTVRSDVPADLERILVRCLEKNRDARYASAAELWNDLRAYQSRRAPTAANLRSLLRRPRLAIPVLLILLAAGGAAAWLWLRGSRVRWARDAALPEMARQVEKEDFFAAYRLARQAERYLSDNREFQQLWRRMSFPCSVRTTPSGAQVFIKDYMAADAAWEFFGKSPIEGSRIPEGDLRWRIEKEGFDPMESALEGTLSEGTGLFEFVLTLKGAAPPGMVRVPGGQSRFGSAPAELRDFWIDKYEVTNRQFKEFVDRGAYQKREYWKRPFVKNGQPLAWEEAMGEFRDATGRPGPATWELGTYPEGREDYPVAGVSWYEAAAYAEFAGKSLPTVHHWHKAANPGIFSDILRLSNFGSQGSARVGSHQGLGPYGTLDMAGNVKEWCDNEAGGSRRYIMGGAWSDPSYVFGDPAFEAPFDRSVSNGLRCAKYDAPLPEALTAPVIENLSRDYSKETPVPDEIFRIYANLFSYDRTELRPVIESVDESSQYWRREKITFNAAYGGERVIAYLFLPRNAVPPYQTVIYFPESPAEQFKSIDVLGTRWFDFIIRSGRAFLYPIYKGTFERRTEVSPSGPFRPNARRDQIIQWSKDLGRSIDYLETRKDIDPGRLAYYGFSLGAVQGPVLTAIEGRLKTSVWLGGGFPTRTLPPEIDAIHFAPRVKIPVLMVNGRQDFIRPVETSQMPLFRLLGTPEKDKRHALFDGGHLPPTLQGIIKEILDWLDRYLGPVKAKV